MMMLQRSATSKAISSSWTSRSSSFISATTARRSGNELLWGHNRIVQSPSAMNKAYTSLRVPRRTFCTPTQSSKPRPRPQRASPSSGTTSTPAGGTSVKRIVAENWPYGVLGALLFGASYFTYDSYVEKKKDPMTRVKEYVDELFSNVQTYADPDPEMFQVQYLQMLGNPIMQVPPSAQDGSRGQPIVTVVFTLEGTLLKQFYDRKYGYRYERRPNIGPLIKGLYQMETSAFFWSTSQQGVSLGDPNSIAYKMLKEEKVFRTAAEMMSSAFGKEHTFIEDGKSVVSIAPLPRFKPNVLLVDCERRNYDKQPNNTLLIKPYTDEDDDGSALMDVLAFMQLFRRLFKARKVRSVEETMIWLKDKHPQILNDPYKMGEFIRAESADIRARQEEIEQKSLKAVMRGVHGRSEGLSHAKAVTAHSSRYERVPEESLVSKRINKLKSQQQQMMKAQQAEMQKQQGGDESEQ